MRHSFEAAGGVCQRCGLAFCEECLVFALGPDKPPLCVPCALAASGVRAGAAPAPRTPRRERKRRRRAHDEIRAQRSRERERAETMALDLVDEPDW